MSLFKTKPALEVVNEEIHDSLFESFSKKEQVSLITLSELRSQITSNNQSHNEVIKLVLLMLLACFVFTGIYTVIIAFLGLFKINIVISILMGCSSIAMFYGSAFVFGKWLDKFKIFSFQKEEENSRILFKQFNNSDTSSLLSELKETLSQNLEKTQIKKYNLAVYDFIKEGIARLDGDFSKLKYEIDSSEKRKKFSFEPFRSFLGVVSELEDAIENAKSIKIINE